ncbi:MFS transporter [Bifidobacterium catulorum]|uniref:Cytochrome C biogenesis protein CcdA n=1 Tax=Bifidobacterium catulorum TaxID=1630173 RepID=A0A2U2MRR9_9BIFI|nr:MFS transporter [Bifidobacterium catulorum]PWG59540.1 cytochrome C biogenesis protein CcdA [Bifidobacterium catulorum]
MSRLSSATRKLIGGFLAIAVFMTGDGFELTFLSKYMVDHGFAATQASLLITVYGLFAAAAAWTSGVLAEMFGAKRLMLIGATWWIVIQIIFLAAALPSGNYPFILFVYSIRGVGYPLFIYSFVVLMAETVDPAKLSSAMGWFWTSFSMGIGVFGAYLPSYIIPVLGEYKTFWCAMPFAIIGTIMCILLVPNTKGRAAEGLDRAEQIRELTKGATILVKNRQVAFAAIVRVINNLVLYGFPVIMPLYLSTHNNGGGGWFPTETWMRFWGFVFVVTLFANVFWGWFGDRFGWMMPVRWFGCVLLAGSTLFVYYVPQFFGANAPLMWLGFFLVGVGTCAFVPLTAVVTTLAPGEQGAALSAYNLAAGLTTFAGPLIATIIMPIGGFGGVCWAYAILYAFAFVLTLFIRPKQPGFDAKGRRLIEEVRIDEAEAIAGDLDGIRPAKQA